MLPRPVLAWLLIGTATGLLEVATIALGLHPTREWSGLRAWVRETWPWTWVLLVMDLFAWPVALAALIFCWTHPRWRP